MCSGALILQQYHRKWSVDFCCMDFGQFLEEKQTNVCLLWIGPWWQTELAVSSKPSWQTSEFIGPPYRNMGEGLHREVWVTQTRLTFHLMGDSRRKAYSRNPSVTCLSFSLLPTAGRQERAWVPFLPWGSANRLIGISRDLVAMVLFHLSCYLSSLMDRMIIACARPGGGNFMSMVFTVLSFIIYVCVCVCFLSF